MNFIKLTYKDGTVLWVNLSNVTCITKYCDGVRIFTNASEEDHIFWDGTIENIEVIISNAISQQQQQIGVQ